MCIIHTHVFLYFFMSHSLSVAVLYKLMIDPRDRGLETKTESQMNG